MNVNVKLQNRKKYVVENLDAAKAAIQNDFGDSGTIESIEEVRQGGIMGFLGRRRLIVIAGTPMAAAEPQSGRRNGEDGQAFLKNLRGSNHGLSRTAKPAEPGKWEISAAPGSFDQDRLKEIISGLRTAALKKNPEAAQAYGSRSNPYKERLQPKDESQVHDSESFATTLAREQEAAIEKLRQSQGAQQQPVARGGDEDMREQMLLMRNAISDLSQKFQLMTHGKVESQAPETLSERNLRELKEKLLEHDFEPDITETYINDLRKNVEMATLEDSKALQSVLADRLKKTLRVRDSVFEGLDTSKSGVDPRIMVFVGPTGVGKTTTIAKLAETLTAKGKKVALLTVDTFKVGGLEQLQHYSVVLDVALDVVFDPEEIEPALDKHADKDVILVDTMGRSQRDVAFTNLKSFLNGSLQRYEVETHLCVSSNTRYRDMLETIKAFNHLQVDCLLFTKLDETCSFGSMLSVLQRSAKEISYVTCGQVVPGNYRVIDRDYLADLMFRTSI